MNQAADFTTPTSAIAEISILRSVFSEHSISDGLDQLAGGLGIFFQAHVQWAALGDTESTSQVSSGAQTEWLEIDGQPYSIIFLRDTPLTTAQRQHARSLIELSGRWFDALAEVNRLKTQVDNATHIDPLTRLANTRYFLETLRQSVARSERSNLMLAVLHIDLIGFKAINEALGDEIGDELLFSLSEQMRRLVRTDDLVARHGPDEFLILLNHVGNQDNVSRIVERFGNSLISAPIPTTLWKGARIGIALYPFDGDQAENLLEAARIAVLSTKEFQEAVHAYYHELPVDAR